MNNVVFYLCIFALLLFCCADLERNKFYEGDDDGGVVGGVDESSSSGQNPGSSAQGSQGSSSSVRSSSSSVRSSSSLARSSSSGICTISGYCLYASGECYPVSADDCCEYGIIVANRAACSSTAVKFCSYGTCVGGNGWECSGSGGCYMINNSLSEASCRSTGTVVDCCPADTRPPSADYPVCSIVSSSSLAQSSSSLVQSSSPSGISSGSVSYGGQAYRIVTIGSQTWMKENLNYNVSGSKCYDNNTARCNTYGRLYDWATAMALPASCNTSTCSSQIQYPNHQGICPKGWHIPSDADWYGLVNSVGGSSTAGKHLKAASGWNPYSGIENLDTYGFSALGGGIFTALPGDYGLPNGGFVGVGEDGYWWSSSESSEKDSTEAYIRDMNHRTNRVYQHDDRADWGNGTKNDMFSVRCVKNVAVRTGKGNDSSSSGQNSSSSAQGSQGSSSSVRSSSSLAQSSSSSGISYGSVSYGGQAYRIVTIGSQTWMTENLNYNVSGSKCYDNNTARCNTYGRLYDWATAMALPASCNTTFCASQIKSPHQGICPSGWHIPSQAEWDALKGYVQSYSGCSSCDAKLLKATTGWNSNSNGTDRFGFTALPGGGFFSDGSFSFGNVGDVGVWWSAGKSEVNSRNAYGRYMYDNLDYAGTYTGTNSDMFSVRCLQD